MHVSHTACISILSLTTASHKLHPQLVDENISPSNAAKNGLRRPKTGPPAPLKGTCIPTSENIEMNLGLPTSSGCT